MEDFVSPAQAFDPIAEELGAARAALAGAVIGQERVIDGALIALLSGGHGLLVGAPGLAKTRLVRAIGRVFGMATNRVQFTPDLMPSDILGAEVLETARDGSRAFRFIEGPVFCQLLMADEINRASPRTQSALLQAMEEKEVTIAGAHRALPAPFHVLATQNPLEQEGTYPLPEAQLDRFLLQINVDFPDRDAEREIVLATTGAEDLTTAEVATPQTLQQAQRLVRQMPVGEQVMEAILSVTRALRPGEPDAIAEARDLRFGPGPRGAQALVLAIRARALLDGRAAPDVSDVSALASAALIHRLALSYGAEAEGRDPQDIIRAALEQAGLPL
ncbi:AAA family ATPase [Paracoccaceae bacterium GXU_MW_L88]